MIKAAVLGYGNIGSGVVEVLLRNKAVIAKKAGEEIVPECVLDLRDFPGDVMEKKVVKDIHQILDNPEISIVVETMGGTKPAYDFVKSCLLAGKHVATSNKELVAAHGAELLKIAKEKQVNFLFEASVGGGIPIIRPLNSCITSDAITEITGILNGTTNYMLTAMVRDGVAYDEILKKAQELGYAERHPEADVEGHDACRKIAILSSLAFGKSVDYKDIYTEGITAVTDLDMKYAKKLNKAIKLFGTSKLVDDDVFAMVTPVMIGESHPLYPVNDVMNGILVRGEAMGDLMFYGAGAGKLPTASAVVADVVAAAVNGNRTEMSGYSEEKQQVADYRHSKKQFFVRVSGAPKGEVLHAFGATEAICLDGEAEYGLVTSYMEEAALDALTETTPGFISRLRLAE